MTGNFHDKTNRLRWLAIGIGDITTKRVIPAIFAEPRSELCALVTRDLRKAEAYPGARGYTNLDDALAGSAIDAVYVASPVALHAPQTIAALRAAKHVLCEKPVALNFMDAQSMAEAARDSGRLLGIAFYRRLFPKILRAKALIEAGAVGQPLLGEAHCHGWLENEDRPWLHDPALAGGGPLYDIASHRIDLFNFLFGKPQEATGLRSNAVHHLRVEDSATVLTGYQGGIRSIVDVRWNSRVKRDQMRIIGTEGEIDLDPLWGPELKTPGGTEMLPAHSNVHYPLIENFVDAVLAGKPLACPAPEAIQTDWVTSLVMRGSV